jgi:hypothetical protein
MLTISRSLLVLVALAASLCGCKSELQPSPMGKLTPDMLAELEKDCDTPLVIERVCGRRPWREDCDKRHHPLDPACYRRKNTELASATKRVWCRPLTGWSIWADRHDRILGVCVDNPEMYTRPRAERLERVHRFLTKYFPDPIATEMKTFMADRKPPIRHVPELYAPWLEGTGLVVTYQDPDDDLHYERSYLVDHPPYPEPPRMTLCWEVHIKK